MKYNSYVLTISYGDYTTGIGGTDKVILSQHLVFGKNSISTLHISPLTNIGRFPVKAVVWQMIEDGEDKGVFSTESVIKYLAELSSRKFALKAVLIHHLKNIHIDELSRIVGSNSAPMFFYLHDYMSICPFGGLLKNGKIYCDVTDISIDNCRDCCYYSENLVRYAKKIEQFFSEFDQRLCFVAPSDTAKKVWTKRFPQYSEKVYVIFHQGFEGKYQGNISPVQSQEPVKIAFVGYQSEVKGWSHWYSAVNRLYDDKKNYLYYQLGMVKDHADYIKEINVDFKSNLMAMTNELRRNQIDVAVLWSTLPETYSYTFYEAFSANCFIITNSYSGNIANQVRLRENGIIGERIDSLYDILKDEDLLRNQINAFREKCILGPGLLTDNSDILSIMGEKEYFVVNSMKKSFRIETKVFLYRFLWNLKKLCKREK